MIRDPEIMVSAPVLETERLILRPFRAGDFEAHSAILTHPEVQRYLGPALSREDLWRRTVGSVGMWSVVGFGGWMVIDKASGRLVGNTGFFDARRDLAPDFGGAPEVGWIFDPQVHGQGIAREACSAALSWADSNLQPTPIWAIVDPVNERSLRFGASFGFERLADSIYNGEPIAILKRPPAAAS
jgi:RimJ/RimL family protein N-acetyltransferase